MPARPAFSIAGVDMAPGTRQTVELPVSILSDHTPVTMSVHVVHGKRPGPTLFVSAAVHGDEIIGVEICRRLLRASQLGSLRGTLMIIPIVNTFGFLSHSRYLPDRRDLNRSFPGTEGGSLAGRLANLFMREIVGRADLGIDLHSAAIHRTNMPQIRYSPSNERTTELAESFGAPITIRAKLRDGSLRAAAQAEGVDILLFEAGEALRFDELSIRAGVAGILRVMRTMDMIASKGVAKARVKSIQAATSSWLRAPAGGLLRSFKTTGAMIEEDELLGIVSDPFGDVDQEVRSDARGLIIGRTNMPVVNEGDALFHIAAVALAGSQAKIDSLQAQLEADAMFDEDEII